MKYKHFLTVPFTGLGLYDGFRGNKWLKNRIAIFKHFVIPSLQSQTNKDFTLVCCWRKEEKNNPYVKELSIHLDSIKEFKTIHTFSGVLFYDDKYEDKIARERLITSIHATMQSLVNDIGDSDYVLMTIQPSDDLYCAKAIEVIQNAFLKYNFDAVGFQEGYIMNYLTKEVAEYNPKTNPPFYTIRFAKKDFIDPFLHLKHTMLKRDVNKYKIGCPLPSHEYLKDVFLNKYGIIKGRAFLVGTHLNNISTGFNIPYKGEVVSQEVLKDFGIYSVPPIKLKSPLRKKILFSLPYKFQRKIRYWLTEKFRNDKHI